MCNAGAFPCDVPDVTHDDIDLTTSEQIIEAAARGENVRGFEALGDALTALHAATPDPGTAVGRAPDLAAVAASRGSSRIGRRVGVASVVAFLAFGGAAAALTGGLVPLAEHDDGSDDGDTDFNFGYDEEHQVFVWNTVPHDSESDCELDDDPVDVTYAVEEGDISASTEGGECEFMATEIAGPNGQVNHGQFMKAFNEMYDGTGRGCINRFLAQSDLGQGDQQIRVDDVDPGFESVNDGDEATLGFEMAVANCERPDNGKPEGVGDGKPESVGDGKPESPGKSGDAPGRNR